MERENPSTTHTRVVAGAAEVCTLSPEVFPIEVPMSGSPGTLHFTRTSDTGQVPPRAESCSPGRCGREGWSRVLTRLPALRPRGGGSVPGPPWRDSRGPPRSVRSRPAHPSPPVPPEQTPWAPPSRPGANHALHPPPRCFWPRPLQSWPGALLSWGQGEPGWLPPGTGPTDSLFFWAFRCDLVHFPPVCLG